MRVNEVKTVYDEEIIVNDMMILEGGVFDDIPFRIGKINGEVKMLEMSLCDISSMSSPTRAIEEAYFSACSKESTSLSPDRQGIPVLMVE